MNIAHPEVLADGRSSGADHEGHDAARRRWWGHSGIAKREASPGKRLRSRLASRGWNLWTLMLGFWVPFLVGQFWYESTQVAAIPYSRFLECQQAGRVGDLVVGSDAITGTIVDPEKDQPGRFRTVRVDPELADRAREGRARVQRCRGEHVA